MLNILFKSNKISYFNKKNINKRNTILIQILIINFFTLKFIIFITKFFFIIIFSLKFYLDESRFS